MRETRRLECLSHFNNTLYCLLHFNVTSVCWHFVFCGTISNNIQNENSFPFILSYIHWRYITSSGVLECGPTMCMVCDFYHYTLCSQQNFVLLTFVPDHNYLGFVCVAKATCCFVIVMNHLTRHLWTIRHYVVIGSILLLFHKKIQD